MFSDKAATVETKSLELGRLYDAVRTAGDERDAFTGYPGAGATSVSELESYVEALKTVTNIEMLRKEAASHSTDASDMERLLAQENKDALYEPSSLRLTAAMYRVMACVEQQRIDELTQAAS